MIKGLVLNDGNLHLIPVTRMNTADTNDQYYMRKWATHCISHIEQ